jgi:hypothetical protein
MTYETATIYLFILAGALFILAFALLIYAFFLGLRLRRELARLEWRHQRVRDLNGRPYRERL